MLQSITFRMQCIEEDESKIIESLGNNTNFIDVYNEMVKKLKEKKNRTSEEDAFITYSLAWEYQRKTFNENIDVGFFTIFTNLFPEIKFRLYYLKSDQSKGETYVFSGDMYTKEDDLPDLNIDKIINIGKFAFGMVRNSYEFAIYKIYGEISTIETCIETIKNTNIKRVVFSHKEKISHSMAHKTGAITGIQNRERLNFKKFTGFDQIQIDLLEMEKKKMNLPREESEISKLLKKETNEIVSQLVKKHGEENILRAGSKRSKVTGNNRTVSPGNNRTVSPGNNRTVSPVKHNEFFRESDKVVSSKRRVGHGFFEGNGRTVSPRGREKKYEFFEEEL